MHLGGTAALSGHYRHFTGGPQRTPEGSYGGKERMRCVLNTQYGYTAGVVYECVGVTSEGEGMMGTAKACLGILVYDWALTFTLGIIYGWLRVY